MGIGRLVSGRFNLVLSVRHNANTTRLNQWRASWERASRVLFDATDGQHQFGDIYVCNNSSGGRNADAWLLEEDGRSSAGGFHVIGSETIHMTIYGDERFKPFILVHEFGHYGYGNGDEYSGPAGDGAVCIGGTTSDACVMEAGWWDGDRFGNDATGGALVAGRVNEFCVASNHDPDNDTWQESMSGISCWETMVGNYPAMALPAGTPVGAAPSGASSINWVVLVPEQRFVVVVDRSGSMTGDKLTEAKYGADWWADNAVVGDKLSIVSFATGASVPYPLHAIAGDPDRTNAQSAVGGITAGGQTSIGGGLRKALNQILGAGARAATQVIVLLTDGFHNSGESPSAVLPDLIANGVRVYTIGVGTDIDAALLQNIANSTGGTFYRIDPSGSISAQETQIRYALQEISGIARDNGGVVTTIAERGDDKRKRIHKVLIEPGSEMATFAVSWPGPKDFIELELEAPDGTSISRSSIPANARELYSKRPYLGFQIERPQPGYWVVTLFTDRVSSPDPFRLFVFSENPRIDGGLTSPRARYKVGARIPLYLQTYFRQPVTRLNVTGVAHLPGGARVPLQFVDDGDDADGDDVPMDGLYSTIFRKTKRPGMYRFEVDVESDGSSVAYADAGEKLRAGEAYIHDPIPPFRRRFTLTLAVGRERFKHDPDPDKRKPRK